MELSEKELKWLEMVDTAMDSLNLDEETHNEFRRICAYFGVTYAPEEEKQMFKVFQTALIIGSGAKR